MATGFDGDGHLWLSGERLLLCDDIPEPSSGACETILFESSDFLVADLSQIELTTVDDVTTSTLRVRLTVTEDGGLVVVDARPW